MDAVLVWSYLGRCCVHADKGRPIVDNKSSADDIATSVYCTSLKMRRSLSIRHRLYYVRTTRGT